MVQFVDIGVRLIAKGREKQKRVQERDALLAKNFEQLSSFNNVLHEAAESSRGTAGPASEHRLDKICDEGDRLVAELERLFEHPKSRKEKAGRPGDSEGGDLDDLVKRLNAFKLSVMEMALISIWYDSC